MKSVIVIVLIPFKLADSEGGGIFIATARHNIICLEYFMLLLSTDRVSSLWSQLHSNHAL